MDGLFKSIDGGGHWFELVNGLPKTILYLHIVSGFAIDPLTPTILYAEMLGAIFKSLDGGDSWKMVYQCGWCADEGMEELIIDPINPAILYGAVVGGVYKSTDGAENWKRIDFPEDGLSKLLVNPKLPSTLYALTDHGYLFISTDGGASWDRNLYRGLDFFPGDVHELVIDPIAPFHLYALFLPSGRNTFYQSIDGGENWSAFRQLPERVVVNDLQIEPGRPSVLFAATENGLYGITLPPP
jgi:photosystem II stability/assembly factor-like uncharacterized protein